MANNNPKVVADPEWYIGEGINDNVTAIDAVTELLPNGGALTAMGFAQNMAYKAVAFDGGAGSGAVGTVALFTVTGAAIVRIIAICTESLVTGAGATISVGTAGTVDGIIAVTTGVDIDAGDIWFAAAPATVLDTLANAELGFVIGDGADIQANVLVDAITDGTIAFTCFWTPLTPGATVVAA